MPAQFNSLITMSIVLPIVFGIGITVAVLLWVRRFMGRVTGADLKATGQDAQATILKIWDTGTTVNMNPVVGFVLEVRAPAQAPYQVETTSLIPRLMIAQYQPGAIVPIKVDPANPSRVAIANIA
jgi:hypothetical protein